MTSLANHPKAPTTRPWWRQVSISNLLLLTVIAGLAVSLVQTKREAAKTKAELAKSQSTLSDLVPELQAAGKRFEESKRLQQRFKEQVVFGKALWSSGSSTLTRITQSAVCVNA